MIFDLHRPYPGVVLVATDRGAVLFGAPADAFKATKSYCAHYDLPFPRTLVAPQTLLVEAAPQFNPEFFLYDFLFVYGAAFRPELADERLELVLDASQVHSVKEALRITLTGPTRHEMHAYTDADGRRLMSRADINTLADIMEHMAIKKGDRPRTVDDSVRTSVFDRHGQAQLLGGALKVIREGPIKFRVEYGHKRATFDLRITPPVVPFATLPVPRAPQAPMEFAIKALGTRSGFDLSGPTTGFVLWVNGRAVIYDGPVGTRYLLERQGISSEDIDAVILSHCHEDHMGAFVELILAGQRPKVFTAEPIYRSALIKLACYFQRPETEVAQLIDYHRITPGEPFEALGATFDFFYTVHSIPTIGVSVRMKDRVGHAHRIQISGDTMHHEGLKQMRAAGVLSADKYREMRHLIPARRQARAHFFADVGEAIIHGHPQDWQGNPNTVLYYHCPESEHTLSFGHRVAQPGESFPAIVASPVHPAVPARLLSALSFLELKDPGWVASLLFQGRMRQVNAGAVLMHPGSADRGRTFSVIVSGLASVRRTPDGEPIATLRPGEFFGAVELNDGRGVHEATITAETPMEIFDIDAQLFHDYIQRQGLHAAVQRIWARQPMVASAKLFRHLDLTVRHQIAKVASEERYKAGTTIIAEGTTGDDFYLLVRGRVEVTVRGKRIAVLKAAQEDSFFGELAALAPNRRRNATVRAVQPTTVLRIGGADMRALVASHMAIRYAITLAIRERDPTHHAAAVPTEPSAPTPTTATTATSAARRRKSPTREGR